MRLGEELLECYIYIYFVRKTVKIQNEKRYTSYVAVWQRNGTGLGWIRNA